MLSKSHHASRVARALARERTSAQSSRPGGERKPGACVSGLPGGSGNIPRDAMRERSGGSGPGAPLFGARTAYHGQRTRQAWPTPAEPGGDRVVPCVVAWPRQDCWLGPERADGAGP
ncbi:hypothetical protein NDU88_002179 [Pleurodeles waltl]|uniref:Uncharacterized protein n=1 Tax=Pleurodeles waltl TaxID=8319 RepID=A0AAV7TMI9_PLEWA|nr:hypothetical protein NDU88_002179 [Pleurodeles waltl]